MYIGPKLLVSMGFGIMLSASKANIATGYTMGIARYNPRRNSCQKSKRCVRCNLSTAKKANQEQPITAGIK